MQTIALISRKGGSGKTTLAVHLALSAYLGRRHVLVADTGNQLSAAEVLMALSAYLGRRHVLVANTGNQVSAAEVLKPRGGKGPTVVETTGRDLCAVQRQAVRDHVDLMVIDTAAGLEESLSHAIVLADLSLLVVRPSFLDIASAVQSLQVIRRMKRSALVVLSQAPPAREGVETPTVQHALAVFKAMNIPVVPVIVRVRLIYQTAMQRGCAVQEIAPSGLAAREIEALWDTVEHSVHDPPRTRTG